MFVAAVLIAIPAAAVGKFAGDHIGLLIGLAVVACAALAGAAFLVRRSRIRTREIDRVRLIEAYRLAQMTPADFERLLASLCERDGCRDVRVVGGAGDLGADVTAKTPDGRRIVLQAKRYQIANTVGSPDLQKFGGTCFSIHKADVAALVTTAGRFTPQARGYAKQMNIRLFDNNALSAWVSKTGPSPWG
ncbi:restriction endonuclease [Nocardia sp. SYP-A9097]|uniref:restriction endonuclease n=1 Tax=Nocardia sp. SYP-A9097 TaxID=2663237 RepID=UPI002815BB45|nr:restriction endonuclease [Nocardia sp. SYP-A9097]